MFFHRLDNLSKLRRQNRDRIQLKVGCPNLIKFESQISKFLPNTLFNTLTGSNSTASSGVFLCTVHKWYRVVVIPLFVKSRIENFKNWNFVEKVWEKCVGQNYNSGKRTSPRNGNFRQKSKLPIVQKDFWTFSFCPHYKLDICTLYVHSKHEISAELTRVENGLKIEMFFKNQNFVQIIVKIVIFMFYCLAKISYQRLATYPSRTLDCPLAS